MFKLFKKQTKPTAIHPDYKKLIEKVFTINGDDFYAFKNLADMPVNRYLQIGSFQEEASFKLTTKLLFELLEHIEKSLNEGKITRAIEILSEIKLRLSLKLEPDILYRLASCVYFYKDEDLSNYDYDLGDKKIELFKKENVDNFFLNEPLSSLAPLRNISAEDIRDYSKIIKIRNEYLKYLDIENS